MGSITIVSRPKCPMQLQRGEKSRDIFFTDKEKSAERLQSYLKETRNITEAKTFKSEEGFLIRVSTENQNRAFIEGQRFALENLSQVSWIDFYGLLGDIGYLKLLYLVLNKEIYQKTFSASATQPILPNDLLTDLEELKKALNISQLLIAPCPASHAIRVEAASLDYPRLISEAHRQIIQKNINCFEDYALLSLNGERIPSNPKEKIITK